MEKLKVTVDEKGKVAIWMNGQQLHGVRGIEFYWEIDEIPTHKVEFVTQAAKFEAKDNLTVIKGGEEQ